MPYMCIELSSFKHSSTDACTCCIGQHIALLKQTGIMHCSSFTKRSILLPTVSSFKHISAEVLYML